MSSLPLHPAIVHVPMGLAIIVPFVALGVVLAVRRGLVGRRTWYVVLALQAALVAGALVAIRTGGLEAQKVERVVGETPVEAHEEAAELFAWAAGVGLAASIAVVVVPAKLATAASLATTLLMFGVLGLGLRTGHAGGRLVYVHGAAAAYRPAVPAAPSAPAGAEGSDRDHDVSSLN